MVVIGKKFELDSYFFLLKTPISFYKRPKVIIVSFAASKIQRIKVIEQWH